mgnify:CR=1 FL=1
MPRWEVPVVNNRLSDSLNVYQRMRVKSPLKFMKKTSIVILSTLLFVTNSLYATEDKRQFVKLPEMMQEHMMANMRDHLVAINEILLNMEKDELDKAAEIAESRLGMSSLDSHGAGHMAGFMPQAMRQAGTSMHKAASRFARKLEEGDALAAYKSLSQVTSACVACHAGYRIR